MLVSPGTLAAVEVYVWLTYFQLSSDGDRGENLQGRLASAARLVYFLPCRFSPLYAINLGVKKRTCPRPQDLLAKDTRDTVALY